MLTKFRNVEDIVKKYSNAGYKVSYEEENSLILEKVVGKEGRKVEVHIQKSKLYPTVVIVFPTVELEESIKNQTTYCHDTLSPNTSRAGSMLSFE